MTSSILFHLVPIIFYVLCLESVALFTIDNDFMRTYGAVRVFIVVVVDCIVRNQLTSLWESLIGSCFRYKMGNRLKSILFLCLFWMVIRYVKRVFLFTTLMDHTWVCPCYVIWRKPPSFYQYFRIEISTLSWTDE